MLFPRFPPADFMQSGQIKSNPNLSFSTIHLYKLRETLEKAETYWLLEKTHTHTKNIPSNNETETKGILKSRKE